MANEQLKNRLIKDLIAKTVERLGPDGSIHGRKGSNELYGDSYMATADSPGIEGFRDFFKEVSIKKKNINTPFITFDELVEKIKSSYSNGKIDNSGWNCPMSAFTTEEQVATLGDTLSHYRLVSVPGGFKVMSCLLFFMQLLTAKRMRNKLSDAHLKALPAALLIALFIFYEDLGLGGINHDVMNFYANARKFITKGVHPKVQPGEDSKQLLYSDWCRLLMEDKQAKIKPEHINMNTFEMFIFGMSLGEIYSQSERGAFRADSLLYSLELDGIPSEDVFQFAMCVGFLRRSAQGRGVLLEHSGDQVEDTDGCDTAGLYNKIKPEWLLLAPNKKDEPQDSLLLEITRTMLKAYTAFGKARSQSLEELKNGND